MKSGMTGSAEKHDLRGDSSVTYIMVLETRSDYTEVREKPARRKPPDSAPSPLTPQLVPPMRGPSPCSQSACGVTPEPGVICREYLPDQLYSLPHGLLEATRKNSACRSSSTGRCLRQLARVLPGRRRPSYPLGTKKCQTILYAEGMASLSYQTLGNRGAASADS